MQAIILAAGSGKRLSGVVQNLPKGLIEIGGRCLLEYSLEALSRALIRQVSIVIGFCGHRIQQKIGDRYKDIEIRYVSNSDFHETGSMASLYRMKGLIGEEGSLVLESDLLYDPDVLTGVLESGYADCILVSALSGSGDEVYICAGSDGKITALGKKIPDNQKKEALGELVGISKFSKSLFETIFQKAEKDFAEGHRQGHYEECVFAAQTPARPVYAEFRKALIWTEIDNEQDWLRAKNVVYPKLSGKFESLCKL